jgi:DTW domain-containing protein YfiP
MRSVTPRDLTGHCPRCVLNLEICICEALPRVETRTEIVLVRHVVERGLTSNTGRFVALALPRSQLIEYGGGPTFDDALLHGEGTALLYASGPHTRPLAFVPRRLVVLDGTFRQARRMYKRIAALRDLPELALPPPSVVPTRLRKPTHAEGMSTLEAVAAALGLLEGPLAGAPLYELHSELVRRADRLRGRKRDIVLAGP